MVVNRRDLVRNVYDILLPFLAIGIFFNLTSAIICFVLILFRSFFIGKKELAIYLLLFGTGFFGLIFQAFRIPIPGSAVAVLFGLIFIWDKILLILKRHSKSFLFLFLIYLVFFVSYLYGPKTDYSNEKLLSMLYYGFFTLLVFILFVKSQNISNRDIAQLLILTSISYFAIGLDYFNYSSPQGLFDFYFFRASSVSFRRLGEFSIGYHTPALLSLYGLGFLLSAHNKIKAKWYYTGFFVLTSLLVILMSGARQGVAGFIIVFILYIFFFTKVNKVLQIFLIMLFVTFSFLFISQIDSKYIQLVFQAESIDASLNRNYERAFDIIKDKPLFGEGLGGYPNAFYRDKYPHNIVLEILSEAGVVGLMLCFIIVIIFLWKKNIIYYSTANTSYYFIIVLAFVIRTMISEDLGSNIIFFSLIFSMVQIQYKPRSFLKS